MPNATDFVDLWRWARAKGCRQKRRFGPRRRWGEVPGGDCQIRLEDLVQIVFARAEVRHDLVHLQYDRSVMKAAPYCFPDWVVHRSAVDVISFFYVSNRSFHWNHWLFNLQFFLWRSVIGIANLKACLNCYPQPSSTDQTHGPSILQTVVPRKRWNYTNLKRAFYNYKLQLSSDFGLRRSVDTYGSRQTARLSFRSSFTHISCKICHSAPRAPPAFFILIPVPSPNHQRSLHCNITLKVFIDLCDDGSEERRRAHEEKDAIDLCSPDGMDWSEN